MQPSVKKMSVDMFASECLAYTASGHQRDFALGGSTATQNTNLAEMRAHAVSPKL
jgi:hypothetical protein